MPIKDLDLTISTGDEKEITKDTPKINGVIEAFIITSNKPTNIMITFSEATDIILYDKRNFSGISKYIPIRCDSISKHGEERYNYSPANWHMNNRLRIQVMGTTNTDVNLTIRYKGE